MKIRDIEDKQIREKAIELAITSEAREWRVDYRSGFEEPKKAGDFCLIDAFSWENTLEGYDFWSDVYSKGVMLGKPKQNTLCPEPKNEQDDQVNPKHYKENLFGEELQYVMVDLFGEEKFKAFCQLNVFKYRMRAGKKADKAEKDIQKAMWYEEKLKSL